MHDDSFLIKRGCCNKSFLQELNDQEFEACYIFKHKCSHEAITAINERNKLGGGSPLMDWHIMFGQVGTRGEISFRQGQFRQPTRSSIAAEIDGAMCKKLIFFCGD